MSLLFGKYIELLRQYILSDDFESKNQLLAYFPPELREKVVSIQKGFDENIDSEIIASKIGASEFQDKLEELQSLFQFKKNGIDEQLFENELNSAFISIERKDLKKRFIDQETFEGGEFLESELKSAITKVERKFLKKKLQQLDEEMWEERNLKFKGRAQLTGSFSPRSVADYKFEDDTPTKIAASRSKHFSNYIKYAAAACIVVAIGFGVYQYTKQDSGPESILTESSDELNLKQTDSVLPLPIIETFPIADISTVRDSYSVLKSGLGYGEIEEKLTIELNNQKERVQSIEKAISGYADQLNRIQNQEAEESASDLNKRISSLQAELTQLKSREKQYAFDGKVLKLYTTSISQENQILRLGADYYLSFNGKFFKLSIAKEPQTLTEETDSNVLNALDKIIFNAD